MNTKQLKTQIKAIILLLLRINQLGPIQRKWIWSLIIHPGRKMMSCLGEKQANGSYKACCLGELALIAGLGIWRNDDFQRPNKICIYGGNNRWGSIEDYNAVGLYSSIGNRVDKMTSTPQSLAGMNDSGYSWPDIAVVILKNPIQYLSKKV